MHAEAHSDHRVAHERWALAKVLAADPHMLRVKQPVCGLVAGLDEGMAAGLSGGGRLEFVERITGGSRCCRARFAEQGRP